MNKRQKKKLYKKKHGVNPINKRDKNPIDDTGVIRVFIKKGIDMFIERIAKTITEVCKTIKEMPEEEFQDKIQQLTLEQRAIVQIIRNKKTI